MVSWNIGLRGLRQLVASDRGADKTAAKDQHGVTRQLGYGSVDSLLDSLGADVVALQECKLTSRGDLSPEIACPSGWDSYHAVCGDASGGAIPGQTGRGRAKTGYAGVAVYVRVEKRVVAAEEGVTGALTSPERLARGDAVGHYGRMSDVFDRARMLELDSEGRCVLVDFGAYVLLNVYVPSLSSDDEERGRFKLDFLSAVEIRYRALLDAGRKVVLCGDWNVSYGVIDSAVAVEEKLLDEDLLETERVPAVAACAGLRGRRDDGGGSRTARGCIQARLPLGERRVHVLERLRGRPTHKLRQPHRLLSVRRGHRGDGCEMRHRSQTRRVGPRAGFHHHPSGIRVQLRGRRD